MGDVYDGTVVCKSCDASVTRFTAEQTALQTFGLFDIALAQGTSKAVRQRMADAPPASSPAPLASTTLNRA
eukprot:6197527-Pleurochrysis_carterae.AAC.2